MRGSGLRRPRIADSTNASNSSRSSSPSRDSAGSSDTQLLVSAPTRRPRARSARIAASMRGRGCDSSRIASIIGAAATRSPAARQSRFERGNEVGHAQLAALEPRPRAARPARDDHPVDEARGQAARALVARDRVQRRAEHDSAQIEDHRRVSHGRRILARDASALARGRGERLRMNPGGERVRAADLDPCLRGGRDRVAGGGRCTRRRPAHSPAPSEPGEPDASSPRRAAAPAT